MATLDQLANALKNADAAGDTEAAKALAGEIRRMQTGGGDPRAPQGPGLLEDVGKSIVSGLAQGVAAIPGLPGDILAFSGQAGTAAGKFLGLLPQDYQPKNVLPTTTDIEGFAGFKPYEAQTIPGRVAGTVASFVPGAAAGGGVVGGARAILPSALKYSVVPGVASETIGSVAGAIDPKLEPYARVGGALLGGGLQAAATPVVASKFMPDAAARAELARTVERSGRSAGDVETALTAARADGQPVFTVADALGHAGQRALSTVVRNPHEGRQAVVDALQSRQAGQGRRISTALAEGFDAPDTAAQRTAALTEARGQAADVNYAAARRDAGPVDVSNALARIDDVLTPGVTRVANPGSQLANDSVEGVLSRARSMLGNGREQLSDFNAALRAKQDLDDMIGRAVRAGSNNQARLLTRVRDALDDALAAASKPYAAARDEFRAGSRRIEAVDAGRQAATRGRFEDTIPAFEAMPVEERAAFRAGYVDPLIEKTQGAPIGANKARPLLNDATAEEFPAFASPGRADRLNARLDREQTMFETNQTALGGSKTADNLADAVEMSQFDPSVMRSLLHGRPIQAIVDALVKVTTKARGMSPGVMQRLSRSLMETRPDVARNIIEEAQRGRPSTSVRRVARALLQNLTAAHGSVASQPLEITVYGGNRGRAQGQ